METSLWILGYGPVLVHKQFVLDVPRCSMRLNGLRVPKNPYDATRLIYDVCGHHYFIYSKMMNQTLGNHMVASLQRITSSYIFPVQRTYQVSALYNKDNLSISATMVITVDGKRLLCTNTYDICKNKIQLCISI